LDAAKIKKCAEAGNGSGAFNSIYLNIIPLLPSQNKIGI
jgi:hypothetical protein